MKMSRACSGMLSSKNEDFQILKNCQKHKMHVHHVHHSSMVRVTVLSLQTSLSLARNMNETVAKELYHIFPRYRNFDTGNFSLTLSIRHLVVSCISYICI